MDSMKGSVILVCADSESVHVHGAFVKYCQDRGIGVSPSGPYLKEMNGQAHRYFDNVMNMTACIDKTFWVAWIIVYIAIHPAINIKTGYPAVLRVFALLHGVWVHP